MCHLDLKPCSVVLRKITPPVSVKRKVRFQDSDSHKSLETQSYTFESSDNSSIIPAKKKLRSWTRPKVIQSKGQRILSSSDTESVSVENSSSDSEVTLSASSYSHRERRISPCSHRERRITPNSPRERRISPCSPRERRISPNSHRETNRYNFRSDKTKRPVYVDSPFSSQAFRFSSDSEVTLSASPYSHRERRISRCSHRERRISPYSHRERRISPCSHRERRISPNSPRERRISPCSHRERRISPNSPRERRISPNSHRERRISPNSHRERRISPNSHRETNRYNFRSDKTKRPVYVDSPFSSQTFRFSSSEIESESQRDESGGNSTSETDGLQDIMNVVRQINVSLEQGDLSSSTSDSKDLEKGTDISAPQFPVTPPPRRPTARKSTVNKIPDKPKTTLPQKQASNRSSDRRMPISGQIQAEHKMETVFKTSIPSKNSQREMNSTSVNTPTNTNEQLFSPNQSRTKVKPGNTVEDHLLPGSQNDDNGENIRSTLTVINSGETTDSAMEIDVEELSDSCLDPKNTLMAQQAPPSSSSLSSLLHQLPEIYDLKVPEQSHSLPTARKTTRRRHRSAATLVKSMKKKTQANKRRGSKTSYSESVHSSRQVARENSCLNSGQTLAELSVDHEVDLGSQDRNSQKNVMEEVVTSPTITCNPGAVQSQTTPKELSTNSPDKNSDSQELIYQYTATELSWYEDGVNWRNSNPPDPPSTLVDSTPWIKGVKYVPPSAASRWKGSEDWSPPLIAVGSGDQISEDKIVAYKIAKELRGKDSPTKVDLKESCAEKRNLDLSARQFRNLRRVTAPQICDIPANIQGILHQPRVQQTSDSDSSSVPKILARSSHASKIEKMLRRVKRKLDSEDDVDINKPRKLRKVTKRLGRPKLKHKSVISNRKRRPKLQPTSTFSGQEKQLHALLSNKFPKSRTKSLTALSSSRDRTDARNYNRNNNQEARVDQCESSIRPLSPLKSTALSGACNEKLGCHAVQFQFNSAVFAPPSPEVPFLRSFKSTSQRISTFAPQTPPKTKQASTTSPKVCPSVSPVAHSIVQVNNTQAFQLHGFRRSLSHPKSRTNSVCSSARHSSTTTPTKEPRKQSDAEVSPQSLVYPMSEHNTRCLSQSQSQHYYGPMQIFAKKTIAAGSTLERVSESEIDSPPQTPTLLNMKQMSKSFK